MTLDPKTRTKIGFTFAAWFIGLLIFFPILWTVLTSFKSEAQAIASPPSWPTALSPQP